MFLSVNSSIFSQNDTILKSDTNSTKLLIDKTDSIASLFANMQSDHNFFGYSQPDSNSTKLILFSIYTNQVKDNPHHCKYGAHYSDTSLEKKHLKFICYSKNYGQFKLMENKKEIAVIYFKNQNFKFDE